MHHPYSLSRQYCSSLLVYLEIEVYLPLVGIGVEPTDELFRTFLDDGYTSV